MSMPIDAIEAVAIARNEYGVLLLLGVLALLAGLVGLAGNNSGGGIGLAIIGIGLVIVYLMTRKTVLALHAGGATMTGMLSGGASDVDAAMRFLDAVQRQVLAARGSMEQINRTSMVA